MTILLRNSSLTVHPALLAQKTTRTYLPHFQRLIKHHHEAAQDGARFHTSRIDPHSPRPLQDDRSFPPPSHHDRRRDRSRPGARKEI